MNYGMADELQKLTLFGLNGKYYDAARFDKKYIIEYKQCAFDDMGYIIDSDELLFEYDSEYLSGRGGVDEMQMGLEEYE